ncbi:DUF2167 domain-containing protein [Paenibacillus segetis]|uniref:Uncharacterized protein n=1 Tax=Paenibacillus segetis TaxID=1325360 RepID=A0ABQ1YID1_9BACL|nr:DUF2167 domain-containing protein [Paenibacillus segetis]GGH27306.1 hypothetical protein GCM10008013_28660 [Paenibacillus segetis]
MKVLKNIILFFFFFCLINTNLSIIHADYDPDDYQWVEGGHKIEFGNKLADITLPSKFLFLPTDELIRFQKENGNIPSGYEVGSVHPVNLEENWLVVFEYYPVGYVSDLDYLHINDESLLTDYIIGTTQSNKDRGVNKEVEIIGWKDKPSYNPKRHELTYSLFFRDAFGKTQINYFVRLLSRNGYMSATLVTDVTRFDDDLQTMKETILPFIEWKEDEKYDAYNQSKDGKPKLNIAELVKQSLGIEKTINSDEKENKHSNSNSISRIIILSVIISIILIIVIKYRVLLKRKN